jgi:hypothetical protein
MSMIPVTFQVDLFKQDPVDTERSTVVLLLMLEALVGADTLWLAEQMKHGKTLEELSIYKSPVIYKLDERDSNDWLDIPNLLRRGYGDCKSLSAWRIAELRMAGVSARPFIRWPESALQPKRRVLHALVRWPGGKIEDPSLALGMRGTIYRRPVFVAPEGSAA